MNALLLITLLSVGILTKANTGTDDELEVKWRNFKVEFDKTYASDEEEMMRKANFLTVEKQIELHNSIENREFSDFRLGHNPLSDWSEAEKKELLGYIPPPPPIHPSNNDENEDELDNSVPPPTSLDLRNTTKCIGPVKNQHINGRCGSCWVFCSIVPVEFDYCMARNQTYTSLSEQQVIDCSGRGCNGGYPYLAWSYLKKAGGSDPTSVYPYVAPASRACTFSLKNAVAKVVSYNWLPSGSVASIVAALIEYGPIPVGIQVNAPFASYKSGIYSDPSCVCTKTNCPANHCVTIVGYGTDPASKKDFWIIRNSWGTGWGNKGYIQFLKGVNMCAVENFASYVIAN